MPFIYEEETYKDPACSEGSWVEVMEEDAGQESSHQPNPSMGVIRSVIRGECMPSFVIIVELPVVL